MIFQWHSALFFLTRPYLLFVATIVFSLPCVSQPPPNCECLWQGSFSQITDDADFIISGEVIASKGNSADIRIDHRHLDLAINYSEFKTDIRIWGDDGKQCRPDIHDFPIGSQWVLALKKITSIKPGNFNPNTPNISYGRLNDYYLSKCGAYWLKLEEGYISGNLVQGHRWQWQNKKMNPVRLELVDAYIKGIIPEPALIEAAKPLTETKKLMNETRLFIQGQKSLD